MISGLARKIIRVLTVAVLSGLAGVVVYHVWLPSPLVSNESLINLLPATADVAVLHRDLETDWRRIRGSNWFKKLIARPEVKRFAHKNRLDRAELSDTEKWILDLVGDRVLAATVANPAQPGRYDIFAFAPIGGRAQRLELWADLIQRGQKAGLRLVTSDHQKQQIVRVLVEDWPPDLVVKYTKLRGVAVISISESEDTLERYLDGQTTPPGVESLAVELGGELGLVGWLQIGAWRSPVGPMRWVLESVEAGQLRLTTLAPLAGPPPAKVEGGMASAALAARLPADALMRLRGRLSEWSAIAAAYVSLFAPDRKDVAQGVPGWLKENAPWLGDAFAAGMLPGRVMSAKLPLPVPQLAVVVENLDERQAQAGIERFVMDLNKRHKMNFALQAATVGKSPAQRLVLQSPEAAQVKRWPVFSYAENALLAASGDDILAGMLARGTARITQGGENSLVWEVEPTVRMARGALAAYTLAQMFTGQQTPPDLAQGLTRLDLVLDVLGGVRKMTAKGRVDGTAARLVMDLSCEDVPAMIGGNK